MSKVYGILDMIRFGKLCRMEENIGKSPIEMIKMFNRLYPEKSVEEKRNNIAKLFAQIQDDMDLEDVIHARHCCVKCGCKYGEDNCPVVNFRVMQRYNCPDCK